MGSFRRTFIKGILYTSASKYIGILMSMGITFVLARLLSPSDFGIIAIAYVMINLLNLVTDFGLGPAILQSDELEDSDLSSLFNFTFLFGLIGTLVLFFAAPYISDFYKNSNLSSVIRILSVSLIFISLNTVPNALLLKEKKFKEIAIRAVIINFVAGVIAILGAFHGLGVYALVCQALVSNISLFAYNFAKSNIRLHWYIHLPSLKKVFNYSLFQFLSSLINFASKELDKPLIGKFLQLSSLGYYEKSYRLMQLPVNNLTFVFTPVLQPLFKDISNNDAELDTKYCKLLSYLSLVAFPLTVFLFFSAQDIILFFYGNNWKMAIEPFRMLSLSSGFLILLSTAMPIFQASNNVRTMLLSCSMELMISITFLLVGLYSGVLENTALMISVGVLFRFMFVFNMLSIKVLKINVLHILSKITIGIVTALISAIFLYIISLLFIQSELSFLRITLNFAVVLITTISVMQIKGFVKIQNLVSRIFK